MTEGTKVEAGSGAGAQAKQRLFISYGRDEFQDLAIRLARDLRATQRYEVWVDKDDLIAGHPWDEQIEKGLDWVAATKGMGCLILLMTPHSVGRPRGFCFNEIRYALDHDIHIVPIMLVTVPTPILINTHQWLDMTDCIPFAENELRYQAKLKLLCTAIETHSLPFEDGFHRLRQALRPIPYTFYTTNILSHFVERRSLIAAFDTWIADPAAPRVFWLMGPLGVGKSTLAAWLSQHRSQVKAFHVCGRLNVPKSNYRDAVRSIAWQLATQLPLYAGRLGAMREIEELCRDPEVDLLDRLIVQPMHGLTAPGEPIVILIDALDEAAEADVNTLADLLGREMDSLPRWIRFALMSSDDRKVTVPLQAWTPREIDPDSDEFGEEILEYVDRHIACLSPKGKLDPDVIEKLLGASEGNWLYLSWAREALEKGSLTFHAIDAFPQGLGGACHYEFAWRFQQRERYRGLPRSLLSVLAAAGEPLPIAEYARVLKRDESDVRDVVRDLSGLLVLRQGHVRPFHYALVGWLTDEAKSGEHSVSARDGHHLLAEDGWAQFERGPEFMLAYARTHLPRHLLEVGDREGLERCVTDARFIAGRVAADDLYELARYWKSVERSRLRHLCAESHARLRQPKCDKGLAHSAALGTGKLLQQAGHYEDAITYFKLALRHAQRAGDTFATGQAELNIGWCLRHVDEFEQAIEHTGTAMKLFREVGSEEGCARVLSVRGICRWHLREDIRALADLREAGQLYEACGDDRNRAEALNHLGIVYRSLGMFEEAMTCLQQSRALSTRFKDVKGIGKCLNSLGTAFWWKGDSKRALDYYRRADASNEEANQPYVLGLTANNRGYIYLEKRLFRQALKSFLRAQTLRKGLSIVTYEMLDLSGIALANHYLGRAGEAKEGSRKAVSILRRYATVEDLERAFYNHYLITKGGKGPERDESRRALRRALELVSARMRRIGDAAILARYQAVPLVKQILEESRAAQLTLKRPSPKTRKRVASVLARSCRRRKAELAPKRTASPRTQRVRRKSRTAR